MADYDEDWLRHQAHVLDLAEGTLPIPPRSGWSVTAAAAIWTMPADFPALMGIIAEHKFSDESQDNLPERVALLVIWNLTRPDLDAANQQGAAWAVLVSDMRWHEWDYRNNLVARRVLDAHAGFFQRDPDSNDVAQPVDVPWVATLIRECFLSPAEQAQLKHSRVMAAFGDAVERVGRLRQAHEARQMQRKFDFRLPAHKARPWGQPQPSHRQFRRRGGTR